MGTRSLTVFIDSWTDYETKVKHEKEIAVLYKQWDGFPDAWGKELKDFLRGKKIVNGYNDKNIINKDFNGMGNLAVQVISEFSDGIKEFHLEPTGQRDCGEEYIYFIRDKEGKPDLTCFDVYATKFVPIPGGRI